jgi:hypothetical protein
MSVTKERLPWRELPQWSSTASRALPECRKRSEIVRGLATRAYHAALVASELCARDKADVIRLVREKYDTFGPALMELAEAAGDTAALLEVIRSGESRLMVALAVIEGEPD